MSYDSADRLGGPLVGGRNPFHVRLPRHQRPVLLRRRQDLGGRRRARGAGPALLRGDGDRGDRSSRRHAPRRQDIGAAGAGALGVPASRVARPPRRGGVLPWTRAITLWQLQDSRRLPPQHLLITYTYVWGEASPAARRGRNST